MLVSGGSGFYLKAFFAPVADDVEVSDEVRGAVAALLAASGLPALVEELRALNPAGLGALDIRNPRRVVGALERCRASGRTLADLMAAFSRQRPAFSDWQLKVAQLDRPRDELDARIEARVRRMLADGLVEEVRRLVASGLKANPSAAKAIGYRETIACLDGRMPADELAAAIGKNTRALVRKQLTWFRTQLPAHPLVSAQENDVNALF